MESEKSDRQTHTHNIVDRSSQKQSIVCTSKFANHTHKTTIIKCFHASKILMYLEEMFSAICVCALICNGEFRKAKQQRCVELTYDTKIIICIVIYMGDRKEETEKKLVESKVEVISLRNGIVNTRITESIPLEFKIGLNHH